jgi:myo-inositol-1(or 4)-monophosphatase
VQAPGAAARPAGAAGGAGIFDAEPGLMVDLLEGMIAAAINAARFIRARAEDLASIEWHNKAPSDFVSDVDTGAEARIHQMLSERPEWLPDDTKIHFLGEESSPDAALGAGLTYVVDPLDGTTNFLHGYPWYAVSIGALLDGTLVAGVVLNAATDELFTATLSGGAFRNGDQITVSSVGDPRRALVGTGFPFKYPEQIEPYLRQLPAVFRETAGVRRAGSAALDLADVACGRFDAFWELRLAPWDVAAGLLLVREAGGFVTDLDGVDARVTTGPIVAGNPLMHRWLLETLRDESRVASGG